MHILLTCKIEDDRIKNEGARVFTRFFQLNKSEGIFLDAQGQLTPQSLVRLQNNQQIKELQAACENRKRFTISLYGTYAKLIVCACPYFSIIGLSAMTLYYPVQDKTATPPINTQNYYTKI